MRKCTYCKKEKADEDFIGEKEKQYKTCTECREKKRISAKTRPKKELTPEQKERIARTNKEWRNKNRIKLREQSRLRYHQNIDKYREKGRREYAKAKAKDSEKLNRKQREYRAKNKERVREKEREYRNTDDSRQTRREYRQREREKWLGWKRKWYSKNKERIKEHSKKARKLTCKYELYKDRLVVDDAPTKGDNGKLLVQCKFCKKLFAPTVASANSRVYAILGHVRGEMNFYCSSECKRACPVYLKKTDPFRKKNSPERDPMWSRAVKTRDGFKCVKCGETENLRAHHIEPVGLEPSLVNDIDNGVTLCEECHRKVHRTKGCTIKYIRDNRKWL